jgi:predicted DNA-binding transcriptional regulator AlpA
MQKHGYLNRMYRYADLPRFVGMHRTQINELIKSGRFPRPVRVGNSSRAIAWLERDLIAWQQSLVAHHQSEIQA